MFSNEISLIDNRLKEILGKYQELKAVMEYSLFTGGKRFRPLLVLLTLKDLNIDVNLGLDVACAIEMIHTYSLVHDDLPAMDNDDIRRGQPTAHIAYGENVAILGGDALLTEAFYWLSNSKLSADKKIKIIQLASSLAGANGMIRGQYLDLTTQPNCFEDIDLIHTHKTKDLIELALQSAAIIADVDIEVYREIALYLGKAFQIKDDMDDIEKFEDSTILKAIGKDNSQTLFIEYRLKCLQLIEITLGKQGLYQLVELVL